MSESDLYITFLMEISLCTRIKCTFGAPEHGQDYQHLVSFDGILYEMVNSLKFSIF